MFLKNTLVRFALKLSHPKYTWSRNDVGSSRFNQFHHFLPHRMLHIFRPDTKLARSSSIRALTYTTQVRSSGSQVFVGNRNHRAEPVSVLRRAPTLTDEQRQQRVGSRAFSPSELWPQSAKERQESLGFDLLRSIQLSPGKPDTVPLDDG